MVKRLNDVVKEEEIIVHTLSHYPDMNNSIKMEVGIEDCLHIEFEYNKSKLVLIWFRFYQNEQAFEYFWNYEHVQIFVIQITEWCFTRII